MSLCTIYGFKMLAIFNFFADFLINSTYPGKYNLDIWVIINQTYHLSINNIQNLNIEQ